MAAGMTTRVAGPAHKVQQQRPAPAPQPPAATTHPSAPPPKNRPLPKAPKVSSVPNASPLFCEASHVTRAFVTKASFDQGAISEAWLRTVRSLLATQPAAPEPLRVLRAINLAIKQYGIEYRPLPVSRAPATLLDPNYVRPPTSVVETRKADCRAISILIGATLKAILPSSEFAYVLSEEHAVFALIMDSNNTARLSGMRLADQQGQPSNRVLVPLEGTRLETHEGENAGVEQANADGMKFLNIIHKRHGTMILDSSGRSIFVASSPAAPPSCPLAASAGLFSPRAWTLR